MPITQNKCPLLFLMLMQIEIAEIITNYAYYDFKTLVLKNIQQYISTAVFLQYPTVFLGSIKLHWRYFESGIYIWYQSWIEIFPF